MDAKCTISRENDEADLKRFYQCSSLDICRDRPPDTPIDFDNIESELNTRAEMDGSDDF